MTDEMSESAERPLESADTAEIAEALSAAQAEIQALKKSRTAKYNTKDGGAVSYNYADLADVIDCLRPPFTKHGLSHSQAMRPVNGHVELVTTIRHKSGQWVRSYYPLTIYQRPQEMGSAISYGRRYSLTALAGIMAEDDDDGKRAQDAEPRKAEPQPIGADAAAILTVAAELGQIIGIDADTLVQAESEFSTKEGKMMSFTAADLENGKRISEKWLKGVRAKLEKKLQREGATAAVGQGDVPF